jgi:hypothetical protein
LNRNSALLINIFRLQNDDLIVEDLDVEVLSIDGMIHCFSKKSSVIPEGGVPVSPKSLDEAEFDTFTRKMSLCDRGTAALDVSLAIKWRRDVDGCTSTACFEQRAQGSRHSVLFGNNTLNDSF